MCWVAIAPYGRLCHPSWPLLGNYAKHFHNTQYALQVTLPLKLTTIKTLNNATWQSIYATWHFLFAAFSRSMCAFEHLS